MNVNRIPCNQLYRHMNKTIYKYQVFQVSNVIIDGFDGFDGKEYDCENPLIHIRELNNGKQLSFMECNYCTFYETELDAKKRQAIDIHKMLNNSYRSEWEREQSLQTYFRKFIDERDLDFFISSVTNHQLHEEEYYQLLSLIAKDYPELLI